MEHSEIPIDNKKLLVYFAANSFKLDSTCKALLDKFTSVLKQNKDQTINILGNADSTGEDSYNLMISQWRSKSVADYLVGVHNISQNRLNLIANGSKNPISSNKNEKGRRLNRRVEILINQR
jgi:outer membrane protein OmpA-like peptidoglycan-associated protein